MGTENRLQVTLTPLDQGPFLGRTGVLSGTLKNYEGQAYHCRSLSLHIPVGNDGDCLYFDDDKIAIASEPPSWNLFTPLARGAEQEEMAVRSLEMKDGGMRPLKETVHFNLTGNVNLAEGSAGVTCTYEYSQDGGRTWLIGSEAFVFDKKQSAFYLKNLITAKKASPSNYCTQFEANEGIMFSWESNGTQFEIYKKDGNEAIYTGTETHFTYEKGVDSDTTFLLRAIRTENSLRAEKKNKTLKLGSKSLFETITLTTVKPVYSDVTVLNSLNSAGAEVALLSSDIKLALENGKDYHKLKVTSDGIITGHLLCSGICSPSSAYMRISVYRDGTERYSARECAFCGQLQGQGNSINLCKPANVVLPVSSQDVVIIQGGMESPSGSMREKGYEAQWFFLPFGKGTVEYFTS